MAKSEKPSTGPQVRYCRTCKEEFAVYRSTGLVLQCPRCGRPASMPLHRHRLRLVAVVILAAVALAVAAVLVLHH